MNSTPLCAVCTKGELLFIDVKTCGNMLLNWGKIEKKTNVYCRKPFVSNDMFWLGSFSRSSLLYRSLFASTPSCCSSPKSIFSLEKTLLSAVCVYVTHIFPLYISWVLLNRWKIVKHDTFLAPFANLCFSQGEEKKMCRAQLLWTGIYTHSWNTK